MVPTASAARADAAPAVAAASAGGMSLRDFGWLILLAGLWGTAFMFISLGLRSFSPVFFAAVRYDIAALAVALVMLARRPGALVPRTRAQWTAVLVSALLNVAAYHAFLFWGQQFTSAAVAAVVIGLNPVLTTVFSRALLANERVGAGGLLGLGLGFSGIVLLATLKEGSLLDAQGLGELAVVAAVASWALGAVIVKRTQHGLPALTFTTWQMLLGALVLHAVAVPLEGGGRATWDMAGVVSLLYLAIAASAIGFLIYFGMLERVGPIRMNLVSYIAPVFAAVSSIAFLDQPFELRALVAFALIAAGFMLVTRPAASVRARLP